MMPRLLGELLGADGVRHHQEADGLQTTVTGHGEVLLGDVGLGAVGGDADHRHAEVVGGDDVVLDPEPRQHQRRDLGVACLVDGGLHQHLLVDEREAVVVGRTAEAVAVGDLDHRHPCVVEGAHDAAAPRPR